MNKKLLNPLGVLITAIVIGVTAGCATVQTAFAPGMVAQAKSADGGASFNGSLVPGSVDLGMSGQGSADAARLDAMAQYYSAKEAAYLERGRSAESARLNGMARSFGAVSAGGSLIPGGVDLAGSREVASSSWNGALIPGNVDLQISKEPATSFFSGALISGSVDLGQAQLTSSMVYESALVPGSVDLQTLSR